MTTAEEIKRLNHVLNGLLRRKKKTQEDYDRIEDILLTIEELKNETNN